MTMLSSPQHALEPSTDGLDEFFTRVRSSNPFMDNRVTGLAPDDVDVDDIHGAAFDQLTALAREACDNRRGLGAILWGEAGIGKSHLLARLMRWAERGLQARAIYLHNLQPNPENLPRSLLKMVVSILTRGQVRGLARTPLFGLAVAFVREAVGYDNAKWPEIKHGYNKLVDRLHVEDAARPAIIDRTVFDVIFRFFESACRVYFGRATDEHVARLAIRWLSGDYLDPEEARELGLPPGRAPDEPVALADNQHIKQVLVALSRLALSGRQPLIFCFDQVDNLDDDQAAALSRFLEAMIDSAPNLLVVTAGIQASLLRWRQTKVIQDSAWDRLAQFEIPLQRLTPQESRRIIAARLTDFVAPFVELETVRQWLQRDALFPLSDAWANGFFEGKIDLRPREVINGAREGWGHAQALLRKLGGPAWISALNQTPSKNGDCHDDEATEEQIQNAIDRTVAKKIAEHSDQRRRQRETLPPDADNLADHLASLLKQYGGLAVVAPPLGRPNPEFPYHLAVGRVSDAAGAGPRTWIRFFTSDSAQSTTAWLRWLAKTASLPERMLLVTEERCPLPFGAQSAAKGKEYYETLKRRGQGRFEHIQLSFEQYVHMDGMQAVVGMARSNDLEIELPGGKTRTVTEQEVIESHHRQGRYLALPLFHALLTEPPS